MVLINIINTIVYYKKLKKFIMYSHDLLFQYGVWRQHMVKLQGITQS